MKRLLLLCFLALSLLPQTAAPVARAYEPVYAVAATQGVWFYTEPDQNKGLFILPYTYYVKVLDGGSPYCRVEYEDGTGGFEKITGYCRREELTFVDFEPLRPFLKKQITLSYTIDGSVPVGGGAFNSVTKSVCFYGTYYAGTALYYYVYADGTFDYVPATEAVSYDLNTDYLVPAAAEEPAAKPQASGLTGVEIALICLLVAAAFAVAVFVIHGKRAPVPMRRGQSD